MANLLIYNCRIVNTPLYKSLINALLSCLGHRSQSRERELALPGVAPGATRETGAVRSTDRDLGPEIDIVHRRNRRAEARIGTGDSPRWTTSGYSLAYRLTYHGYYLPCNTHSHI